MAQRYFDEALGVWVTKCPPGKALGAGDIANWASRRGAGRSGSDGWKERKEAKKWAEGATPKTPKPSPPRKKKRRKRRKERKVMVGGMEAMRPVRADDGTWAVVAGDEVVAKGMTTNADAWRWIDRNSGFDQAMDERANRIRTAFAER